MRALKLELLKEEINSLEMASEHLAYSITRCLNFEQWQTTTLEDLERLESLTSRFSRLSDMLVQRVFRLVDEIELTGNSTVLDRIYRAEKRGWIVADELIKMRELRNLIAHEYSADAMVQIYAAVLMLSPSLLSTVPKVIQSVELMLANPKTVITNGLQRK
jgi:hypothetical protein